MSRNRADPGSEANEPERPARGVRPLPGLPSLPSWVLRVGDYGKNRNPLLILIALGAAGAIIWRIHPDPRVPVLSIVFGLLLVGVVTVTRAVAASPRATLARPAKALLW